MVFENEEQLAERCAYWQKVLRLQDWDIFTSIVRTSHWEDGKYRVGHLRFNEQSKSACILLLHPEDYKGEYVPLDHDLTLVHELLHIHLMGMNAEENTTEGMVEEQAIDAIADALLALDQRDGKQP